jgi:hypothetical protein
MPEIGPLPEPIRSAPRDEASHWSILDQTKAELKASGRPGVVIIVEPEQDYQDKLSAFFAAYNMQWVWNGKPFMVIQHDTEAKALFDKVLSAGLKAELVTI